MTSSPKPYFPSLGALRFYAALTVVVTHVPAFSTFFGTEIIRFPLEWFTVDAVTLFFVMSGFLITHSLLRAAEKPGGVELRRFYVGRALRIMPIYYSVIILTLMLFPLYIDANSALLGSLFLTNIARFAFITTPIVHLWSLCVEEQFIALLPALIKRIPNVMHIFYGVFVLRALVIAAAFTIPEDTPLRQMLTSYQWDVLALSGMFAVFYHRRVGWLRHLYRFKGVIALLMVIVILAPNAKIWEDNLHIYLLWKTFTGIVLTLFVFDLATNPKPIIRLENAVWRWLGKITYGIFAFHILVIGVLLQVFKPTALNRSALDAGLFYLLVIGVSIIVGWLAHHLIEQPFMRIQEHLRARATKAIPFSAAPQING